MVKKCLLKQLLGISETKKLYLEYLLLGLLILSPIWGLSLSVLITSNTEGSGESSNDFWSGDDMGDNLKWYNYTLLRTSDKKPIRFHCFIEDPTYGLFMTPSDGAASIYKSTDEGASWDLVVATTWPTAYMYHDRTAERLYYTQATLGVGGSARFIDLTDDSDNLYKTAANTPTATYDILLVDTIRMVYTHENGGNAFVNFANSGGEHSFDMGAVGARTYDLSLGVHDGTGNCWILWQWSDENAELWKYDESGGTFTELEDCGAGTSIPAGAVASQRAISYDGVDILYFILVVGGVDTLYSYAISTDTLTQHAQLDVALMLDRNTASGVLEKGFHTGADKVYQIKENYKNAHNPLLLISQYNFSDNIIAITDNYLIDDSSNLYEYQDLSAKIKDIKIRRNLIGQYVHSSRQGRQKPNIAYLVVNPDDAAYFSVGDVHIYKDSSDNVMCYGRIIAINSYRNQGRLYDHIRVDILSREWLTANPNTVYTTDKSSEKIDDICDNHMDYTFSDDEVSASALDYSYPCKHSAWQMAQLIRYLEKGVIYDKEDLEIVYKTNIADVTNLTDSTLTWTQATSKLNYIRHSQYQFNISQVIVIYNGGSYTHPTSVDTTQQAEGILNVEIREFGISDATTAQQLAEHIYEVLDNTITSIFLAPEGKGWLQIGEKLNYANSIHSLAADDYMIAEFLYDPKKDKYEYFELIDCVYTEEDLRLFVKVPDEESKDAGLLQYNIEAVEAAKGSVAKGTYTGNDNNNREITGLGFDPTVGAIIYPFGGVYYMTWVMSDMGAWSDITPNAGGGGTANRVRLITDGFEVNNGDANDLYNNLNDVYYYIMWG
jgi:hypothetical protein